MIKIYVDNQELDLFEDESIELNRSIKNLTDISTVFTTFSQSFTVPASRRNNQIFQHWYRDDLQTSISSLKRLDAFITLNGEPIETGGIALEGATIINGTPRDYTISFYGTVSKIKTLVGKDTLKGLDLSTYDHQYTASTILPGFGANSTAATLGLSSGAIFYPLFSPVRNWSYDSTGSGSGQHLPTNIAYHGDHGANVHGVYYYEPKPALQVTKIIDAIEAKYGITFSGSFLSSAPFNQLYMWLHNKEGYTFEGVDEVSSREIVREPIPNITHSLTSTDLSTVDDTLTFFTGTWNGTKSFEFTFEFNTLNNPAYIYLLENGVLRQTTLVTATATPYVFTTSNIGSNTNTRIEFLIARTTANLTIDLDYTVSATSGIFTPAGTSGSIGGGAQTSTSYSETVVINNLIPDMPITEFLNGLIKLYNLVVTSEDGSTFNFQTYDSYYSAGSEIDISRWLDTSEVTVSEIPRYGALTFKYEESDQVLQKRYRQQSGRGYGDLTARFNFDTEEEFAVEVPFDLPFTEKLTDQATGTSFTDFTVYKSIEIDEDGSGASYYGAPVLFYYGENLDISSTPISWVDESDTETQINLIPFCELVSSVTGSTAESLAFSDEINPYLEDIPEDSLYSNYWSSYINQTYNQQVKVFTLSAYLNLGVYSRLSLNDTILWKGRKYLINNMSTNFKTGLTELELITAV